MHRKAALTILELIVVLFIMAVSATIGLAGMFLFRQTVQINNATFDLLSNMQTYENMARNSVPSLVKSGTSPISKLPDAYAVFFNGNNYSLLYCDKTGAVNNQHTCNAATPERANQKLQEFSDITIAAIGNNAAQCAGILFERRTGILYSMSDTTAVPAKTQTCTYQLRHTGNLSTRRLVVNTVNNFYVLQ